MNKSLLSFLGITRRSGNLVFGMDEVRKNILKGNIKLILTAKDISKNSFEKINEFNNNLEKSIDILPTEITKEEIEQNREAHRFTLVETDEDVNKIHERDHLKSRWIERRCKLYRRLISFCDEKRVYSINTMERIET